MKIATAEQMRGLDQSAIRERGIPSLQLMDRAAAAVVKRCLERLEGKKRRRVAVFCGAGNNGGDGVAAARQLLEAGVEVRCFLVGRRDKMTPDCREMEAHLEATGGKLENFTADPAFADWCLGCDLMVDALFGIGLNTALRGDAYTAVQMMNTCAVPVVSVDIGNRNLYAAQGRKPAGRRGSAVRAAHRGRHWHPRRSGAESGGQPPCGFPRGASSATPRPGLP